MIPAVKISKLSGAAFWLALTICLFGNITAGAQVVTQVHQFDTAHGDSRRLLFGQDGSLYGITTAGGEMNGGSIFQITPSGSYQVLYSFPYGSAPYGGLVEVGGIFYGTTSALGQNVPNGYGTMYEFTVSGSPSRISLRTLHSFDNNDGAFPEGELCAATDGNLYGTTFVGGAFGQGTVYQITPVGKLTVLASLSSADFGGYSPICGLTQSPVDQLLYGVTANGGEESKGTVFKTGLSPGTFASVASLDSGSTGYNPQGALWISDSGDLFGVAVDDGEFNGGTIFEITASGKSVPAHSFNGTMGANPIGGLTQAPDGYLYGTTSNGGANNDGTVYRIKPDGKDFTDIYDFNSSPSGLGTTPSAALIVGPDGNLYGATAVGGMHGGGAIFRVNILTPSISGFTPMSGRTDDKITVLGHHFTAADSVTINGVSAAFTVVNDTEILATVPDCASATGVITIYTPIAKTSLGTFTYYGIPVITNVQPSYGKAGESIVITGDYLGGATTVSFDKINAKFHVDSAHQITAIVPEGALTGRVRVTAYAGTGTSDSVFYVILGIPTITGFSPPSGPVGTSVVITGTHFTGASSVSFNHVDAQYQVVSDTQITATVPAAATTGKIRVGVPGLAGTSETIFKVTP